jgi:polysaccharide export outer membrane protein
MKPETFVSILAAATLTVASLSAQASAAGPAGKDDKKPAAVPPSLSEEYRVGAGDKLRIEVYKDPQLSQSVQVRPDGKITLPLLGDIPAAGQTSIELRDDIARSLKDYITNPVVTVMVLETTPQVVYVMGEVNKPGTLPLMGGRLSILQALAMAGGFTDFANKKDIRILRHGKSGMQTLKFNYKEALEDTHEPLQLLPGDTVIVK